MRERRMAHAPSDAKSVLARDSTSLMADNTCPFCAFDVVDLLIFRHVRQINLASA